MNLINITIPNEPIENINSVVFLLRNELKIKNMILLSGDNNSIIIFRKQKNEVSDVLASLTAIGVGVDFGIIDILPLSVTIPDIAIISPEDKETIEEDIQSRVSLEEIRTNINEISMINMNFIVFITLAAIVSGAGLLVNSSVVLIAAMILSPLMGPILAVSYGLAIRDKKIAYKGLKSQLIGISIGFFVGIIYGIFVKLINPEFIFTSEIVKRSFPKVLDVIIAICGGIAVGFCVTGGIQSSLVGIAIAVALLPPVVNSGIIFIFGDFLNSLGSFLLMLTNIIVINLCAFGVFKLKNIKSIAITPDDWKGPEESLKIDKKKKKSPKVATLSRLQKFKKRVKKKK